MSGKISAIRLCVWLKGCAPWRIDSGACSIVDLYQNRKGTQSERPAVAGTQNYAKENFKIDEPDPRPSRTCHPKKHAYPPASPAPFLCPKRCSSNSCYNGLSCRPEARFYSPNKRCDLVQYASPVSLPPYLVFTALAGVPPIGCAHAKKLVPRHLRTRRTPLQS